MTQMEERFLTVNTVTKASWNTIQEQLVKYFPKINARFSEYTIHDESHCRTLEDILDWLVPSEAWDHLSVFDLFLLRSSLWSHDVGMGASENEIEEYCAQKDLAIPDNASRATFLRVHHPSISGKIVERIMGSLDDPTLASLGVLCGKIVKSHGASQLENLGSSLPVGHKGDSICPAYLAILLRLADILDCTADRAPYQLFKLRAITDPTSASHWKMHQATVGVGPSRDARMIHTHIMAQDVKSFSWAVAYQEAVKRELDYCATVSAKLNLSSLNHTVYSFSSNATYDTPFISEVVRVDIDSTAAIATLVGRNIYDDHSVVVRELLQNALDACEIRATREENADTKIKLTYDADSNRLVVRDTGVGMTYEQLKNSLLKSCTSGFRGDVDSTFLLARFGIGFLTVFMAGKRTEVRTRHFEAPANDGLLAVLTKPAEPVEIRGKQRIPIGTEVDVTFHPDFSLTANDMRKWIPLRVNSEIEFRYNGEILDDSGPSPGVAEELEFYPKEFQTSDCDIDVTLRSNVLKEEDGRLWPCGLSFQSIEMHDPRIAQLPDVSSRFFLRGVPLINKSGQRPRFLSRNGSPVIDRVHAPYDVNFLRPGHLELNLARNQTIDSPGNLKTMTVVDRLAMELLAEYYGLNADRDPDKATFAARFISEHWLTLLNSGPIPGREPAGGPDDEFCLDRYKEIWRDVRLLRLSGKAKLDKIALADSTLLKSAILYIDLRYIRILQQSGYDIRALSDRASSILGYDPIIVAGLVSARPVRFTCAELLFSIAKSCALFDATCIDIKHPPFYLFDIECPREFSPTGSACAPVLGTDRLFVATQSRAIGTAVQSGSNRSKLILNAQSPDFGDELAVSVALNGVGRLTLPNLQRTSLKEWIASLGVPTCLVNKENMHVSLHMEYPLPDAKLVYIGR